MENVVLNGFENDAPGDVRSIVTGLADCGASKFTIFFFGIQSFKLIDTEVTQPSNREITSIAYRSPEVYFGRPWSSSTDIWSWGIIVRSFRAYALKVIIC